MNFPPSTFGGISFSVYPIIDELNKLNFEVKVLTTNYKLPQTGNATNKWTKYSGKDVMYVKTKNPAFSFRFFLEGFRQIKKSKQIHLSSIFYFPCLPFAIYSILLGKFVILSPHGELNAAALSYKSWKKKPYLYILTLLLKKITFRATSTAESILIKNYFPKSKIIIIPNFFTFDLPINERKINQFIFLGRISPIKSIENLILACSTSIIFKQENFKFLLVGPFDNEFIRYKETLKELIVKLDLTNNISFLGEVNSPFKEKLISQSKALFLVSQSENFGNVVLESLAQGTPVVASKGTPWQQLETYNCGYWIDNSPEVIASKMDELILMNKNSYNEMSANALLLSKEFTKDKIMPKWLEIVNFNTYV